MSASTPWRARWKNSNSLEISGLYLPSADATPRWTGRPAHERGSRSKQDLQRELHVEGFTGTDAGRAVEVSRRIATLPEPAADGTAGRRQVDAVEQIEKLDAELGAESFRDRYVLENGKINVAESRRIDGIARYGSERTLCRVGVCVWIDPLNGIVIAERMRNTLERIADLDSTCGVLAGAVCIG